MRAITAFFIFVRARPRLAALLGAISISFSGILYLLAGESPETAAFFRSVYGLPLLVAAAFVERRRRGPMPRSATLMAAFAGFLFAIDILFWHHAVDAVGAGLATVLGNLQVVIVAVAAWLLFGERPSTRTLVALPIALGGVLLISGVLGGDSFGTNPQLGTVLGIIAAFAYAGYLIVIRRVGGTRAAEPVAIGTAVTALVAFAAGLAVGRLDLVPSWPAHFWLLLLGLSAQSVGYLFISLSLPRLPAVVTSVILLAQPVLSVIFAMLLLGEAPSVEQLLGVGMLLAGIGLATIPLGAPKRQGGPAAPAG